MYEMSEDMMKLTRTNYYIWKHSMEDLLIMNNLDKPIQGDAAKPAEKSDEEWAIMHRKTVACIRRFVDKSLFYLVHEETKADLLWENLKSALEPETVQHKSTLIYQLINFTYDQTRSVIDNVGAFESFVHQLEDVKVSLDDELQALILINSLPEDWRMLVELRKPNEKLTMKMVWDFLMNQEIMKKMWALDTNERDSEQKESRGRSRNHNTCNNGRRSASRGWFVSGKEIQCYYCKKLGHMKRDCRKWKKDRSESLIDDVI